MSAIESSVKTVAGKWLAGIQAHPALSLGAGLATAAVAVAFLCASAGPNEAPTLPGTIPVLSNTYLYMTDMKAFLAKASKALSKSNIVGFYLGPMKVYLITGARNVQVMFRQSTAVTSDKFMLICMENIFGISKTDLARFDKDKSGRLPGPAAGFEDVPTAERYWLGYHRVIHEHLARKSATDKLAESYQRFFEERLEATDPVPGEYRTVRILDFMRHEMATAAIVALNGPRLLELNPDFVETLWQFDEVAASLAWGLPTFMNREGFARRDRFREACGRYLEAAWEGFDWDGPDAEADWEPHFGARFPRELARWMRDCGFTSQTCAGMMAVTTIFAQNANTTPVITWAVMEVIKDPELFQAIRDEVMTAYVTDPTTSQRRLDMDKLSALPLLQSVYIESLRLHVSINVSREVLEPLTIDGYHVGKGSLLQSPSEIAHYNESVWSSPDHPASEFWAARHIKHADAKDEDGNKVREPQFSMAGRTNDFMPYGGGVSMCPGRFFAKQEILMTIAIFVSRFDVEFVAWKNLDGTPSDRPAQNDVRWSGGASVPPDRDMEVRLKRRW